MACAICAPDVPSDPARQSPVAKNATRNLMDIQKIVSGEGHNLRGNSTSLCGSVWVSFMDGAVI